VHKNHHWLRGIIGGLFLGLGLGVGSIIYAINPVGQMTPWVAIVLGIVIGILVVFVPAPWRKKQRPGMAPRS
jgi:LytS/YehU family sensor histidine kinase